MPQDDALRSEEDSVKLDWPSVGAYLARHGMRLVGLHMHIGSQLFDLAPWRLAVEAIASCADSVGGGGEAGVAGLPPKALPEMTASPKAVIEPLASLPGRRRGNDRMPSPLLSTNCGCARVNYCI